MIKRDFCSFLLGLVGPIRYLFLVGGNEEKNSALGLHLQMLKSAPEPHLDKGRRRVLAESALLEKQQASVGGLSQDRQPRVGFALGVLAIVFFAGVIAFSTPTWNRANPVNRILGFLSAPPLTRTTAPATYSSVTAEIAATPATNLSPVKMDLALTAVPGVIPRPAAITEPTPSPFLTLTRPAQVLPRN
jgi:hypothetical protein